MKIFSVEYFTKVLFWESLQYTENVVNNLILTFLWKCYHGNYVIIFQTVFSYNQKAVIFVDFVIKKFFDLGNNFQVKIESSDA